MTHIHFDDTARDRFQQRDVKGLNYNGPRIARRAARFPAIFGAIV